MLLRKGLSDAKCFLGTLLYHLSSTQIHLAALIRASLNGSDVNAIIAGFHFSPDLSSFFYGRHGEN